MTWIEECFAAWNRGDGESVASFMSDDIVYTDTTLHERFESPAAVAAFVLESNRKGLTFQTQRIFEGVDHYCVEWIMQPHGIPGVSVGTRRDGKIITNKDYWSNPPATQASP